MLVLSADERTQGPLVPAIMAACTAVKCRKTADGMSLAARAYSDRGSRLLDELQLAIGVAGLGLEREDAEGRCATLRAPINDQGGIGRRS